MQEALGGGSVFSLFPVFVLSSNKCETSIDLVMQHAIKCISPKCQATPFSFIDQLIQYLHER